MKAILIFLAGLLFPITFLFGQSAIQKYAGTAMPYPFIKNLSVLNHDGMVPFYINHFRLTSSAPEYTILKWCAAKTSKFITAVATYVIVSCAVTMIPVGYFYPIYCIVSM